MFIGDAQKFLNLDARGKAFYVDPNYETGLLPDKNELIFEEGLRDFIEAMVKWSSDYKVTRGGNTTPITVNTFFVQSMKQYAEQLAPLRNETSDYPMISVALTGIAPDPSRYVPHSNNAIGYIWRGRMSSDGRTVTMKNQDFPVTLSFKLIMWGKLYSDMFQVNYRMTKQFHHANTYLAVGGNLCRLELRGVSDESQLESLGTNNDRVLRWSYAIDCRAWMREAEHAVKTVWEVPVTVAEDESNRYLDKWHNDVIVKETKNGQS